MFNFLKKLFEKISTRKGLVLVFLVMILVLLPVFNAHAQIEDIVARKMIGGTLNFFLGVIIHLLAALQKMLDLSLRYTMLNAEGQPAQVVTRSWEIVRNFANMFFIVGLILMAFATIFSISRYDFRTMIARFLIAALLINFSLTIGTTIIGWSQSLSNVFLDSIGDIGLRLGQNFQPAKLTGAASGNIFPLSGLFSYGLPGTALVLGEQIARALSTDGMEWTTLLAVFFNVMVGSILVFALAVGFIMSFIRVPVLMALLVVSPVAWVCSILPQTMNVNRKWWSLFLGWNLFLPIYMFFIYFGIYFLNQQNQFFEGQNLQAGGFLTGIGWTLSELFGYILAAMFLVGGAKMAMSSSMTAGAGGVAAGIWARGVANARLQRGSITGGIWRATPIPGAYKEARDYYGRKGIPIPGTDRRMFGTEQKEAMEAKIAGGVFRVPGVAEKQLGRNVDAEIKKIKEKGSHLDRRALDTLLNTGSEAQKIAAAQVYAEENYGALSPDQITGVKNAFGSNLNTSLAASTFRKMKWGELPSNELRRLLDSTDPNYIADPNIQSLIYGALIDKGTVNQEELRAALTSARPGQRGSMLKKAKEVIAKSFNSNTRMDLLTSLGTDRENADARRELLSIMATEGDSEFFYEDDASGNLDQAATQRRLREAAAHFENIGDRKTFLENVAKKYTHSAAAVMLNDPDIRLRDTLGNEIITTTPDAELESTRAVFRKLNMDDKLSPNRKQLNPVMDQVIGEDMARDIDKYARHDKFPAMQASLLKAQRIGRRIAYRDEYLRPFLEIARELDSNLLRYTGLMPSDPIKAAEVRGDLKKSVDKLRKIRDDYKKMCEKAKLDADPSDRADIAAEISSADRALSDFNTRIGTL